MVSYGDVAKRLCVLGYTVDETDCAAIEYSISRAAECIKTNINREEIPEGLYYIHVDMAVGFFLQDMKNAGKLDGSFDFSAPAKSITEGDVSVAFASASDGAKTPEARFDEMVRGFIFPPQSVFAAYRRLKW